jgi:site-specific DNA-methyltransferase (adenine-specific)
MLAQYHRAGTERLAAMRRAVNTPAANDEWMPEAA